MMFECSKLNRTKCICIAHYMYAREQGLVGTSHSRCEARMTTKAPQSRKVVNSLNTPQETHGQSDIEALGQNCFLKFFSCFAAQVNLAL